MSEQGKEFTNAQEETFDPTDIEKNKVAGGLAYLIFFLPLIMCPESKYGKFHANQGLLLLIVSVVGYFVLGIIPIIGWLLMPIFGLGVFVLGIMGLINGLNGKAKRLPLFGNITILK